MFDCALNVLLRRVLVAIHKVLFDRPNDEDGLLTDIPDRLSQAFQFDIFQVCVAILDTAFLWVVEPVNHLHNCALTGARWTDNCSSRTGLDCEREALEDVCHVLLRSRISEVHIVELDAVEDFEIGHAVFLRNDFGLALNEIYHCLTNGERSEDGR